MEGRDKAGWTPLFCCVQHNEMKIVQLLVASGCNTDAKDHLGKTPNHMVTMLRLHISIKQNLPVPEVQEVLESDDSVELRDRSMAVSSDVIGDFKSHMHHAS